MSDARVVLCSFPNAELAADVCRRVVDERLAACATLIPQVRSIYRWQGAICDEPEVLALIKTIAAREAELATRIVALHPYATPEVLALAVASGSAAYLAWLAESCA